MVMSADETLGPYPRRGPEDGPPERVARSAAATWRRTMTRPGACMNAPASTPAAATLP